MDDTTYQTTHCIVKEEELMIESSDADDAGIDETILIKEEEPSTWEDRLIGIKQEVEDDFEESNGEVETRTHAGINHGEEVLAIENIKQENMEGPEIDARTEKEAGTLKLHERSATVRASAAGSTHSLEKSHSCEICAAAFSQKTALLGHYRWRHKKFVCVECDKRFSHSGHLNRHLKIHSGEKPHSCDTCGKSFSQRMSLQRHVRIHTGQKPYTCGVCAKAFSDASALSGHMKVHEGNKRYRCNECRSLFRRKTHLAEHIRTRHTGERPYTCGVCGASYSSKKVYRSHVKALDSPEGEICKGRGQFWCDVCMKSFSFMKNFIRHVKKHASELENDQLNPLLIED